MIGIGRNGRSAWPESALEGICYERPFAHEERHALSPAGRDVGHHQGIGECAAGRLPAVSDEVDLKMAWQRVFPVGERPYRYIPANSGLAAAPPPSVRVPKIV